MQENKQQKVKDQLEALQQLLEKTNIKKAHMTEEETHTI
jgi:hypothetical protein